MAFGWNETGGTLPFGPKPFISAINWREPLTRGLVFDANYGLASAHNGKDLVSGTVGAYSGTGLNTGPFGFHRTFVSATDADTYTTSSSVNGLSKISIEILFKPNVTGFSMLMSKGANTAPDGDAFIDLNWGDSTNTIGFGAGRNTASGAWKDTNGVFTLNQFVHLVVSYDDGSTANVPSIYKNGAKQPVTQTAAPSGTRIADTAQLLVGQFPGQSYGATCDFEYVRVWNRILADQEVRVLAGNPWQIYRSPAPLVAANLGGNVSTLTAARGLFGETGEAATLKCGRALIAARGSFGEAGQAAALKYGRNVGAARGVFVVTGEAAGLLRGKGVAAAYGGFVETGRAASFSLSRNIIASCGFIAVGGEPAGFHGGTPVIWSPVRPGTEAWTPAAPNSQTWTPQQAPATSWTVE